MIHIISNIYSIGNFVSYSSQARTGVSTEILSRNNLMVNDKSHSINVQCLVLMCMRYEHTTFSATPYCVNYEKLHSLIRTFTC